MKTFYKSISPRDLFTGLTYGRIFSRGLPPTNELRVKSTAHVMLLTLSNYSVAFDDFPVKEHQNALTRCYNKGWLQAVQARKGDQKVEYSFASPLHRWHVQAQLGELDPPKINDDNLVSFVTNVIRCFSPRNLSKPREVSPLLIQRPPESQFQDEFYRASISYSGGAVIFPEFGSSNGRIDLYIPSKQWGIELLRDGNNLAKHFGRFSTSGTYAKWVQTKDYIILDFRTRAVRDSHPCAFL
jgi:hypothetical protein